MPESRTDVLSGPTRTSPPPSHDFDALVGPGRGKALEVEGIILVTHDADGTVTVADTGDRVGRKGAGWGGGVGVAVGLFAPPLLAAIAVGAAGGAIVGKFADQRAQVRHPGQDRRRRCPPAPPAIIAVLPETTSCSPFEQALPGALVKSVVALGQGRAWSGP